MDWLSFIPGLFTGVFIGVCMMCLMFAVKGN
jgi:hypothetical protein